MCGSQAEVNAPAPRAVLTSSSRLGHGLSAAGVSLELPFEREVGEVCCSSVSEGERDWDMTEMGMDERGGESACRKRELRLRLSPPA